VNTVLLTGRVTRDPELRSLASGKTVTTFTISTRDVVDGADQIEYHTIVAWDRLADIAGHHFGKRQLVAVEGRLQTRPWEDERGRRHWKTEIIAECVEALSGRGKGAMRKAEDSEPDVPIAPAMPTTDRAVMAL
jgi:single-strand DNA-binding protein